MIKGFVRTLWAGFSVAFSYLIICVVAVALGWKITPQEAWIIALCNVLILYAWKDKPNV